MAQDLFAPPTEEELKATDILSKPVTGDDLFAPPTEDELKLPVSQPPGTVAGAQPSSPGAPSPGDDESILSAFGRGVREAIAPGTIDDEDIQASREQDAGNLMAEMAGLIGADLAALAARRCGIDRHERRLCRG